MCPTRWLWTIPQWRYQYMERQLKEWPENFECCLTFEGVPDLQDGPSQKKVDFLEFRRQKLCSLLATFNINDNTHQTEKQDLTYHFVTDRNHQVQGFKFFHTKSLAAMETLNHWITSVRFHQNLNLFHSGSLGGVSKIGICNIVSVYTVDNRCQLHQPRSNSRK